MQLMTSQLIDFPNECPIMGTRKRGWEKIFSKLSKLIEFQHFTFLKTWTIKNADVITLERNKMHNFGGE